MKKTMRAQKDQNISRKQTIQQIVFMFSCFHVFTKKKRSEDISGSRFLLDKGNGFTLVELIVAIAVSAILFGIGVSSFRQTERGQTLGAEADKLASVIRQAQLFSLTGKLESSSRPQGYGVHFTSETDYFIFADDPSASNAWRYDIGEMILEQQSLPTGYAFSASPLAIGSLDIAFSLPSGLIYINASTPAADEVITITETSAGSTKLITINGVSGQVEVQ